MSCAEVSCRTNLTSALGAQDRMIKLAKHQAGSAILWAVTLLIGLRPLVDTFALSMRDDDYTYILLILPVSAAMIVLEWRCLGTMLTPSVRIGFVVLAIAVLIACSGRAWSAPQFSDVRLSISMVALVLSWIGAFIFYFGSRASRQVLFPLCFLFGLVPFPQLALNKIIALLQLGSAWAAHLLFAVF